MSNETYLESIRKVIDNPRVDLLDDARVLDAIPLPDKPNLYAEVIAAGYSGALEFEYRTFSQYSGAELDEMIRTNGELYNSIDFDAIKRALRDYDTGVVYEERFTLRANYEYYAPTLGWRLGDSRLAVTRFSNASTLEEAVQEAKTWAPIVPLEIEDVTRYSCYRSKRIHDLCVKREIVREGTATGVGDSHEVMQGNQVVTLVEDKPISVALDWHMSQKKPAAFIPFLFRTNGERMQRAFYEDNDRVIDSSSFIYEGMINTGEIPQDVISKMLASVYGYDESFAIFQAEHRDDVLGNDATPLRRYSINIILQSNHQDMGKVMGREVVWRDCMRASLYSVY